ncbi:hypothetical protein EVG20_g2190 [Dentipellis fragilis]|uniref:NAD(P)-binding protein n=1 Tax=Dentipellis fragilis TaxID=205917 RepID=A0A4Y9ZBN4_9AGAM|nr:hypothetical protein EVG20_g2190 [Dentipellis fragilis]
MGSAISFIRDTFPPAPTYSVERDIPDLAGKVFLVTGGNTGVGKETIKALLQHNATVWLAARSSSKAKEAIADLKATTGKEAKFLQLDLSDLKSIKESARVFLEQEDQLHVLINNAGVMIPPVDQITKDGYDLQFGTNVLGPFYFTTLVYPLLQRTSVKSGSPSRIVTVGSLAGLMVHNIDFNTLKDGPARRRLSNAKLYMQSKLGDLVIAMELARRCEQEKSKGNGEVVSVPVNPGSLKSDLARHVDSWVEKLFLKIISYPVEMGALSSLYAATAVDGASLNGKFLKPWVRPGELTAAAQDPQLGKELWVWLEEQVAKIDEEAA